MTLTPGAKAADAPVESSGAVLPWLSWACLLVAGWIVLFPLSYTWSYLPTYAFGWWVPLLALILFSERWTIRPAPEPVNHPPRVARFIVGWGILYFLLRMALEELLASRALLWTCSLLYVGALFYWLWIYGGARWVRYFAFPICFLLLCVPWPTQIEIPLVQGLERNNAWVVAQVLVVVFGIPAEATGNVITLSHCVVGVSEACSGIRSLQAAIMIAFLLGELYRFAWPRRGQIVLLAVALALVGNFLRTLFLALLASYGGVAVMNRWHDTAGGFILVFTSVTTWLVCHFLRQREPRPAPPSRHGPFPRQAVLAQRLALGILCAAIAVESATQGWYAWKDRDAAHYPTWTALPTTSGKFQEMDIGKDTGDLLKYDVGRKVQWRGAQGWSWIAYWFRYHPNPWGATVFQSHNPDECLPPAGFDKVGNYDPFVARVGDVQLNVWPEQFSMKGTPVYVFWVVYANRGNFPVEQAVLAPQEGYGAKLTAYLMGIWTGRRGSKAEMESLEAIVTGPGDYPAAKAAYLEELPKMIVPDVAPSSSLTGTVASP